MPNAPLQPCTVPGCPGRARRGRCDRHPKTRRQGWSSLYGPDWPRRRLEYLERHPRCALCPRQARTPDHWPESLRRLLERGVPDPHHDRFLRPLCLSCHSKTTGRNQPGGWNARGR